MAHRISFISALLLLRKPLPRDSGIGLVGTGLRLRLPGSAVQQCRMLTQVRGWGGIKRLEAKPAERGASLAAWRLLVLHSCQLPRPQLCAGSGPLLVSVPDLPTQRRAGLRVAAAGDEPDWECMAASQAARAGHGLLRCKDGMHRGRAGGCAAACSRLRPLDGWAIWECR